MGRLVGAVFWFKGLVDYGQNKKRIPFRNASIAMVAPAGFEPATF